MKIATLTKGKPVQVPLARNPTSKAHARSRRRPAAQSAERCNYTSTTTARSTQQRRHLAVAGHTRAKLRTDGKWLGIDFGFSAALFATNEGQLLGRAMLRRLRELDAALTTQTAALQKRGTRFKSDPYYRALQNRITG